MQTLISTPLTYIDNFLLVFTRIISMFIFLPIFGNRNVPKIGKVILALTISYIIMGLIPIDNTITSSFFIEYGILVLKEALTGLFLGFSIYMAFSILTLAGQFIDYQVGFSMVNVFDPLSQIQFTVTGSFYYFILLIVVLVTKSYFFFFIGLKDSFKLIGLGRMQINQFLYNSFLDFLGQFFLIAMQIALPVFFVILITNAVLGVLARTTPQLNMFVIGFPMKIILGLLMMYLMFFIFDKISEIVIDASINLYYDFIRGMGGG